MTKTPILDKCAEKQIFCITKKGENSYKLTEMCDLYFSLTLTHNELLQLAEELKEYVNTEIESTTYA